MLRRLPGDVLGANLAVLGGFCKGLGEPRALSGSILAAFSEDVLLSWVKSKNSKKPRKTNGFSLIFEVPGGSWGLENLQKSI